MNAAFEAEEPEFNLKSGSDYNLKAAEATAQLARNNLAIYRAVKKIKLNMIKRRAEKERAEQEQIALEEAASGVDEFGFPLPAKSKHTGHVANLETHRAKGIARQGSRSCGGVDIVPPVLSEQLGDAAMASARALADLSTGVAEATMDGARAGATVARSLSFEARRASSRVKQIVIPSADEPDGGAVDEFGFPIPSKTLTEQMKLVLKKL